MKLRPISILAAAAFVCLASGCSASTTGTPTETSSKGSPSAAEETPSLKPFPSIAAPNVVYEDTLQGTGQNVDVTTSPVSAGPATLQVECAGTGGAYSVKIMQGKSEYLGSSGGCEPVAPIESSRFTAVAVPAGYTLVVDAPRGTQIGVLISH